MRSLSEFSSPPNASSCSPSSRVTRTRFCGPDGKSSGAPRASRSSTSTVPPLRSRRGPWSGWWSSAGSATGVVLGSAGWEVRSAFTSRSTSGCVPVLTAGSVERLAGARAVASAGDAGVAGESECRMNRSPNATLTTQTSARRAATRRSRWFFTASSRSLSQRSERGSVRRRWVGCGTGHSAPPGRFPGGEPARARRLSPDSPKAPERRERCRTRLPLPR